MACCRYLASQVKPRKTRAPDNTGPIAPGAGPRGSDFPSQRNETSDFGRRRGSSTLRQTTAPRGTMATPALQLEKPARPGTPPAIVTGMLEPDHRLRGAVLLLGNFDGLHLGHQALIGLARRMAGARPVAVMSCEPHPRCFFGTEPGPFRLATPACKRRLLLPHGVDFIYSPQFDRAFADLAPQDFAGFVLAGELGVTQVIAGPDFRFGRRRAGDMDLLDELGQKHGFAVGRAPVVTVDGARASSSRIRAAIRAGDLRAAAGLLGGGWLVETRRSPCGRLELHPDLCRPRAGRYLGAPEGGRGRSETTMIDITADGGFLPLGPRSLDGTPGLWRLAAQV